MIKLPIIRGQRVMGLAIAAAMLLSAIITGLAANKNNQGGNNNNQGGNYYGAPGPIVGAGISI